MAGVPVISAHQQQRLVAVIVKTEPRAGQSLVTQRPEAGNVVAGVERVGRIDKK